MKTSVLRAALLLLTLGVTGSVSAATSTSSYESYGPWTVTGYTPCTRTSGGQAYQTVYAERTVSVIKVVTYTPDPGQTFEPYRVKTLDYQYPQTTTRTSSCTLYEA